MVQDTQIVKNKMVTFLENGGPTIPVRIAKHIETSILFTSAFLSELLSEQRIKISHMKVGSSPIYYIQENDPRLEKYSEFLKSKEKEAFQRLKQNKFLIDKNEHPAIRVALREINDFAKPFEKNGELIWRYFTIPESEHAEEIKTNIPASMMSDVKKALSRDKPAVKEKPKESIKEEIIKQDITNHLSGWEAQPHAGDDGGEEKPKEVPTPKGVPSKEIKEGKKPTPKITKKKTSTKKNTKDEKFFNTVKDYLSKNNFEIEDIEGFNKESLVLKVKKDQETTLLVAYNKKRVTEDDIVKSHKKAEEKDLKYQILSFGEPLKKTNKFIDAIRDLKRIEKIE